MTKDFETQGVQTGRMRSALSQMRLRDVVRPIRSMHWSDCPDCRQSATGKYGGALACTRCGWNAAGRSLRQTPR